MLPLVSCHPDLDSPTRHHFSKGGKATVGDNGRGLAPGRARAAELLGRRGKPLWPVRRIATCRSALRHVLVGRQDQFIIVLYRYMILSYVLLPFATKKKGDQDWLALFQVNSKLAIQRHRGGLGQLSLPMLSIVKNKKFHSRRLNK